MDFTAEDYTSAAFQVPAMGLNRSAIGTSCKPKTFITVS
jgi:hypothetical protein